MLAKIILVLLFAVISLSDVYSCIHKKSPSGNPCATKNSSWRKLQQHWKNKIPNEEKRDEILDIVQKHTEFQELLHSECEKNGNNLVYEVYNTETYVLKYNISEYRNANISVKILNRLINVNVKSEDANKKTLKDVKLLPDILNFEKANWIATSDALAITIPYKIVFGENIVKDCRNLNRNVIDVPILKYAIDKRIGLTDEGENAGFNIEENEVPVSKSFV